MTTRSMARTNLDFRCDIHHAGHGYYSMLDYMHGKHIAKSKGLYTKCKLICGIFARERKLSSHALPTALISARLLNYHLWWCVLAHYAMKPSFGTTGSSSSTTGGGVGHALARAGALLQGEGDVQTKFLDPLLFRSGTTIKEEKRVELNGRFSRLQTWGTKIHNIEDALKSRTKVEIGKTLDQQLKELFNKKPQVFMDYNHMKKEVEGQLQTYATKGEQTEAHRGPLNLSLIHI